MEKMAKEYAKTRRGADSQSDEYDYSDSDADSGLDDSDDTSDSSSNMEVKRSSISESEELESDSDHSTAKRAKRCVNGEGLEHVKTGKKLEDGGDAVKSSDLSLRDVMERLDQMSASLLNLTQMVHALKSEKGCEAVTKKHPVTASPTVVVVSSKNHSKADPQLPSVPVADDHEVQQYANSMRGSDDCAVSDDIGLIGKIPTIDEDEESTSRHGDRVVELEDRDVRSGSGSDVGFEVLSSPRLGTPSEENSHLSDSDCDDVDGDEGGVVVENMPPDDDDSDEKATPDSPMVNTNNKPYSVCVDDHPRAPPGGQVKRLFTIRIYTMMSPKTTTQDWFIPSTGGQFSIKLHNKRRQRFAFKVKCSDNSIYSFHPVFGFVDAKSLCVLEMIRLPSLPKEDKIVLELSPTPADSIDPMAVFEPGFTLAASITIPLIPT